MQCIPERCDLEESLGIKSRLCEVTPSSSRASEATPSPPCSQVARQLTSGLANMLEGLAGGADGATARRSAVPSDLGVSPFDVEQVQGRGLWPLPRLGGRG